MISKAHYKNLHEKEQEKKLKDKEKAIKNLKDTIALLRNYGLTSDTLFEFYMNSCNFGFRFNPHSKDLKNIFKEALGEK